MRFVKSLSAIAAIVGMAAGSAASGQTVEFRLREMTGQSLFNGTSDLTLDFVIEARVVGATGPIGIASFGLMFFSWAGENAGTFARLRINNADQSVYTGFPTTSTTSGGMAGVAYQFRSLVAQDLSSNGVINPPVTATGFVNTLCAGELSGVRGLTGGSFLLNTLDKDLDGIPDTSPLNGSGQAVPDGSIAPLDPSIADQSFGSNNNFVQLYRFRYTHAVLPHLTLTGHVSEPPTVFTQVQKSATGWQPVPIPATFTSISMSWTNGFLGNRVDLCPPNYNGVDGVNVIDLFDFLNAWFNNCNLSFCPRTADYNCNGATEVQDIFDFMNDWFVGCP